jgi:hypothetical protein
VLDGVAVQEFLSHQADIVSSIPKGWHLDDDDGHTKVEVLAKPPPPAADTCRFTFVAATPLF